MPNNISYKDTAARVVLEEGIYYRYIFDEYQKAYDHLMQSGLYQQLTEKGYMIQHQEVDIEKIPQELLQHATKLYKKILPNQISFQSYPFEWSYGQWRKVVSTYIQINQLALAHGMLLKDATPYNFYFEKGKPVLLDTSSFVFFEDGAPWLAYKQFCTEMLSPLALMFYNGERWARLSMSHLRGIPLNFVSKQLPLQSWFNSTCLLHIHLHGKYANAEGNTKDAVSENVQRKGFTKEKLLSLWAMIENSIDKWKHAYQYEKHWLTYYKNDIASEIYLNNKEAIIKDWLQLTRPTSILDLGANTGRFSIIASEYSSKVIALESDTQCVDAIDQAILDMNKSLPVNQQKQIVAARMDLAETTPNMGVLEKEFSSIYTRAKSQLVLALALSHHLYINDQLSFVKISKMLNAFSDQYAITEFVPVTDEKVQLLLKDKHRTYPDYSEEGFVKALEVHFNIKERKQIDGSERMIYLLEKH